MSSNPAASTSSQPATMQSTSAASVPSGSSSNGNGAATAPGQASQSAPAGNTFRSEDMHFDSVSGKWMVEDPVSGKEFEWNVAANAWLEVVEDDLIKAQQAAYSVQGVDESVSLTSLIA